MKKTFLLALSLSLFTLTTFARSNNELIKYVTDSLIFAETGTASDNCIRDEESGMFLSCFYATSQNDWINDFDGDGEVDILVHFTDEGLGGGGNAFGYDYRIVYMKDGKIDRSEDIFIGGKFSENHMAIDSVINGKIYATLTENYMTRTDYEDQSPLKETKLVFVYGNGKMKEINYSECPMSDMNKNIFKTTSTHKITRTLYTNSEYEDEQHETLLFSPNTDLDISATISGCQKPKIHFVLLNNNVQADVDREYIIRRTDEVIRFLIEETRYTSTLKNLSTAFSNDNRLTFESGRTNTYKGKYKLKNNWDAEIEAVEYENGKKIKISITLEQK